MKLRIKFLSVLFVIFAQVSCLAQISSTYSRIGVGDMDYTYSPRRMGMGQLGSSVLDADFISLLNPASLSSLGASRTELGMRYNALFLANNNAKATSASTDFTGATIAVPISRTYGISLAAGVLPYSRVSYKEDNTYTASGNIPNDYTVNYEGKGGLSKIFLASSYKFPFDLRLGASVEYYFGNINYYSKLTFQNNVSLASSEYDTRIRPRGFSTTFGLITPDLSGLFNSESISQFRIGAAFSVSSDLKADTSLITNSILGEDTLNSASVNMHLPYRLVVGASFTLHNKYLFTFDYLFQPWSKYSIAGKKDGFLRDGYKLSTGFEFRPEKRSGQGFWEQIIWRMGLSFEQTQYNINGQGINEYSVMGGASFPLSYQNTLDIGIQYSIRGTKDANLFQEHVLRLSAGVSLGELWFIRHDNY